MANDKTPAPAGKVPLIDLLDLEDKQLTRSPIDIYGGDPSFHYTWLDHNPVSLERMQMMYGYEIVSEEDSVTTLVPPNAKGERKYGTLILAKISMDRWNKLQAIQDAKTKRSLHEANEAWVSQVEQAGFSASDTTAVEKKIGP